MATNDDNRIFLCTTKQLEASRIKAGFREGFQNLVKFYEDHKDFVERVVVPTVIALSVPITTLVKTDARRKQNNSSERRIYDPSLHCYWNLTRCLTNHDKKVIGVRRKNGEQMVVILNDLGLL